MVCFISFFSVLHILLYIFAVLDSLYAFIYSCVILCFAVTSSCMFLNYNPRVGMVAALHAVRVSMMASSSRSRDIMFDNAFCVMVREPRA